MRGSWRLGRSGAACWVLLATVSAAQSPVPVSVALEPGEITVGDRVAVRLTLVWDGPVPVAPVRFPDWRGPEGQGSWGQAEILEVKEVQAYPDPSGRQVYSQSLTLTAFETGTIELPVRQVAVPLTDATLEVPTRTGVSFTVRSVLPEPEETAAAALEPRPAAPLVRLAAGPAFLATALTLAALCLLAVQQLRRRLTQAWARTIAGRAPPSPYDELKKSLARIHPESGAEPAATAMSFALRRYLGRRLHCQALERTTSEIRRELREVLDEDAAELTVAHLRDSDQVKFARVEVPATITAERLESLRKLVWSVEDTIRRAEAEAAAAEAATAEAATASLAPPREAGR